MGKQERRRKRRSEVEVGRGGVIGEEKEGGREGRYHLIFCTGNKYAKLDSLDVICDRMDHFNLWMEGLKTLVVSNQWLYLYPQRYENSDPTIL